MRPACLLCAATPNSGGGERGCDGRAIGETCLHTTNRNISFKHSRPVRRLGGPVCIGRMGQNYRLQCASKVRLRIGSTMLVSNPRSPTLGRNCSKAVYMHSTAPVWHCCECVSVERVLLIPLALGSIPPPPASVTIAEGLGVRSCDFFPGFITLS